MGDRLTGGLAQAGGVLRRKNWYDFCRDFFLGMELKLLLRQSVGTLYAILGQRNRKLNIEKREAMKLLKFLLTIFLLPFSAVQCFGTTWAAAYPYVQQIDGQNIVVKAYSYAPYKCGPMIGVTKIYSNNKLLYSIDKYYREKIFTSQDGQYLAVVSTSNSAGLTSYSSLFCTGINFNQIVIEVFKNGLPFKTYTLKDVIDTTLLVNNGFLFNWAYNLDFESFEEAICNCKYWRKDLTISEKKKCLNGDTTSYCREWINGCDSIKIFKAEKILYKNSIYVQNNSLFILTNQNTVVKLDFETLEIQQLPFEKIVPDKKTFNPPKLKRKYKKIKLPDKFSEPNIKDGRSFEEGIANLFNLTVSNSDKGTFCVHTCFVLNREGKCIDFYGSVNDERITKFFVEKSINKEMTDKLNKWGNEQIFDTRLIPKGFEAYTFLSFVYLYEN